MIRIIRSSSSISINRSGTSIVITGMLNRFRPTTHKLCHNICC
ncbi:unnamed protein product [Schistosoma curassoni]|uniref:Uncharacterized protein n=1 Tax=Schistosoma curassoni TaxID=6186 RepID=A0A183KCL0_9TREM|nr:unnamed protein product [Schistosoma curassoni]